MVVSGGSDVFVMLILLLLLVFLGFAPLSLSVSVSRLSKIQKACTVVVPVVSARKSEIGVVVGCCSLLDDDRSMMGVYLFIQSTQGFKFECMYVGRQNGEKCPVYETCYVGVRKTEMSVRNGYEIVPK